jgi:hypothetical protein
LVPQRIPLDTVTTYGAPGRDAVSFEARSAAVQALRLYTQARTQV